jgi:hypothetical protein
MTGLRRTNRNRKKVQLSNVRQRYRIHQLSRSHRKTFPAHRV